MTDVKTANEVVASRVTEMEDRPALPAVNQPNQFMQVIERLASRPEVDVDKLEKIMKMQEHILDRDAETAFNASMTQAQNKIELVVAGSKNTQTGSNYADLKAILLKAKPVYTTEGFSLMFYEMDCPKENHKRVGVDIMHRQGHTKKRHADIKIQTTGIAGKAMMTEVHGEGSAFSYGRRYLTCMTFNIPTGDDDDGQKAGGKQIEFIDKDQQKIIQKKLKTIYGDDPSLFFSWLGCETIDTIQKDQFKKILNGLTKAESKKAAETEREPGCDDE